MTTNVPRDEPFEAWARLPEEFKYALNSIWFILTREEQMRWWKVMRRWSANPARFDAEWPAVEKRWTKRIIMARLKEDP